MFSPQSYHAIADKKTLPHTMHYGGRHRVRELTENQERHHRRNQGREFMRVILPLQFSRTAGFRTPPLIPKAFNILRGA